MKVNLKLKKKERNVYYVFLKFIPDERGKFKK